MFRVGGHVMRVLQSAVYEDGWIQRRSWVQGQIWDVNDNSIYQLGNYVKRWLTLYMLISPSLPPVPSLLSLFCVSLISLFSLTLPLSLGVWNKLEEWWMGCSTLLLIHAEYRLIYGHQMYVCDCVCLCTFSFVISGSIFTILCFFLVFFSSSFHWPPIRLWRPDDVSGLFTWMATSA